MQEEIFNHWKIMWLYYFRKIRKKFNKYIYFSNYFNEMYYVFIYNKNQHKEDEYLWILKRKLFLFLILNLSRDKKLKKQKL